MVRRIRECTGPNIPTTVWGEVMEAVEWNGAGVGGESFRGYALACVVEDKIDM